MASKQWKQVLAAQQAPRVVQHPSQRLAGDSYRGPDRAVAIPSYAGRSNRVQRQPARRSATGVVKWQPQRHNQSAQPARRSPMGCCPNCGY